MVVVVVDVVAVVVVVVVDDCRRFFISLFVFLYFFKQILFQCAGAKECGRGF